MVKNKYIKVMWNDHFSDDSWMSLEQLREWVLDSKVCITVGLVTYEDSEKLLVSATHSADEMYADNMCILKNNIIKIEKLDTE